MSRLPVIAVVLACGLFAAPCFAESEMGFKGFGPTIAYVSPEDIDGTVGFGVIADFGNLTRSIGIESTVDYWSRKEGSGSEEVKLRDLVLGTRAMIEFDMQDSKWRPSAGAGFAIHVFKSEVPEVDVGGVTFGGESSKTRIGLDLAGDVKYQLVPKVDLMGQLMYRIVEDVGQFVIGAGLIFAFGS